MKNNKRRTTNKRGPKNDARSANNLEVLRTKPNGEIDLKGLIGNTAEAAYYQQLSDPTSLSKPAKVPYNINNLITQRTIVAKTTANLSIAVAASMSKEILLFPGHGKGEGIDLYSSHSRPIAIGGTTTAFQFACGPLPVNDGASIFWPVFGAVTPDLTFGSAATSTSTAFTEEIRMSSLPYEQVTEGNEHHTRWRLAALSVDVLCTTPGDDIGGTIASVQTLEHFSDGLQSDYMRFGSYNRSDMKRRQVFTWTPRSEDISYWHLFNGGSPTYFSSTDAAGIHVWLNANTRAQTFDVTITGVWEIAGTGYQSIGSPPALVAGSAERGKIISTLMLSNTQDAKHAGALYKGVTVATSVLAKYGAKKAMDVLTRIIPKDLVLEVAAVMGIAL